MREWARRIVKCVGLMGGGETARLQFWTRNKRRGRPPAWTQCIAQVVVALSLAMVDTAPWLGTSRVRVLLRTKGTRSPPIFPQYYIRIAKY